MQRVNFHLTDEQLAWLRGRQETTGVPVAEQIRRAIDREMDMNTKQARAKRNSIREKGTHLGTWTNRAADEGNTLYGQSRSLYRTDDGGLFYVDWSGGAMAGAAIAPIPANPADAVKFLTTEAIDGVTGRPVAEDEEEASRIIAGEVKVRGYRGGHL